MLLWKSSRKFVVCAGPVRRQRDLADPGDLHQQVRHRREVLPHGRSELQPQVRQLVTGGHQGIFIYGEIAKSWCIHIHCTIFTVSS